MSSEPIAKLIARAATDEAKVALAVIEVLEEWEVTPEAVADILANARIEFLDRADARNEAEWEDYYSSSLNRDYYARVMREAGRGELLGEV